MQTEDIHHVHLFFYSSTDVGVVVFYMLSIFEFSLFEFSRSEDSTILPFSIIIINIHSYTSETLPKCRVILYFSRNTPVPSFMIFDPIPFLCPARLETPVTLRRKARDYYFYKNNNPKRVGPLFS